MGNGSWILWLIGFALLETCAVVAVAVWFRRKQASLPAAYDLGLNAALRPFQRGLVLERRARLVQQLIAVVMVAGGCALIVLASWVPGVAATSGLWIGLNAGGALLILLGSVILLDRARLLIQPGLLVEKRGRLWPQERRQVLRAPEIVLVTEERTRYRDRDTGPPEQISYEMHVVVVHDGDSRRALLEATDVAAAREAAYRIGAVLNAPARWEDGEPLELAMARNSSLAGQRRLTDFPAALHKHPRLRVQEEATGLRIESPPDKSAINWLLPAFLLLVGLLFSAAAVFLSWGTLYQWEGSSRAEVWIGAAFAIVTGVVALVILRATVHAAVVLLGTTVLTVSRGSLQSGFRLGFISYRGANYDLHQYRDVRSGASGKDLVIDGLDGEEKVCSLAAEDADLVATAVRYGVARFP